MKLTEWTNLIDYGNALCATLQEKGYDVRLKPYTMYDGRRGLTMQVFDLNEIYLMNTTQESIRQKL